MISRSPAWLLLAIASSAVWLALACSGGPKPAAGLLLGPEDFPGLAVTATAPETAETTGLEPSVQVALTGPSFELLQTLVLFESEERALELIAGIKNDMAALGISQEPVGGFRDISGIDEKATLNGQPAATLFFVEGAALVRLTVTGADRRSRIMELAESGRKKASRQ